MGIDSNPLIKKIACNGISNDGCTAKLRFTSDIYFSWTLTCNKSYTGLGDAETCYDGGVCVNDYKRKKSKLVGK